MSIELDTFYSNQVSESEFGEQEDSSKNGVEESTASIASEQIKQGVVSHRFSKTRRITKDILDASRSLNPKYAFCNCTIAAYKTAGILENNKIPNLPFTFISIPRPTPIEDMVEWTSLYKEIDSERGCVIVKDTSRAGIEMIMKTLGPGTHAIIGGIFDNAFLNALGVGHAFNYVYENTGPTGESKFTIIDSYAESYHEKGLQHPEDYFGEYRKSSGFEVMLFFDKTEENMANIKKYLPCKTVK